MREVSGTPQNNTMIEFSRSEVEQIDARVLTEWREDRRSGMDPLFILDTGLYKNREWDAKSDEEKKVAAIAYFHATYPGVAASDDEAFGYISAYAKTMGKDFVSQCVNVLSHDFSVLASRNPDFRYESEQHTSPNHSAVLFQRDAEERVQLILSLNVDFFSLDFNNRNTYLGTIGKAECVFEFNELTKQFDLKNISCDNPVLKSLILGNSDAPAVFNALKEILLGTTKTNTEKFSLLQSIAEALKCPLNLSGVDLSGVDLSGVDLNNVIIDSKTKLSYDQLKNASWKQCTYFLRDQDGRDVAKFTLTANDFARALFTKNFQQVYVDAYKSELEKDLSYTTDKQRNEKLDALKIHLGLQKPSLSSSTQSSGLVEFSPAEITELDRILVFSQYETGKKHNSTIIVDLFRYRCNANGVSYVEYVKALPREKFLSLTGIELSKLDELLAENSTLSAEEKQALTQMKDWIVNSGGKREESGALQYSCTHGLETYLKHTTTSSVAAAAASAESMSPATYEEIQYAIIRSWIRDSLGLPESVNDAMLQDYLDAFNQQIVAVALNMMWKNTETSNNLATLHEQMGMSISHLSAARYNFIKSDDGAIKLKITILVTIEDYVAREHVGEVGVFEYVVKLVHNPESNTKDYHIESATCDNPVLKRLILGGESAPKVDQYPAIIYDAIKKKTFRRTDKTPAEKVNFLRNYAEKLDVPLSISGADLTDVDLTDVNLEGVIIDKSTIVSEKQLRSAKWTYLMMNVHDPKTNALLATIGISRADYNKISKFGSEAVMHQAYRLQLTNALKEEGADKETLLKNYRRISELMHQPHDLSGLDLSGHFPLTINSQTKLKNANVLGYAGQLTYEFRSRDGRSKVAFGLNSIGFTKDIISEYALLGGKETLSNNPLQILQRAEKEGGKLAQAVNIAKFHALKAYLKDQQDGITLDQLAVLLDLASYNGIEISTAIKELTLKTPANYSYKDTDGKEKFIEITPRNFPQLTESRTGRILLSDFAEAHFFQEKHRELHEFLLNPQPETPDGSEDSRSSLGSEFEEKTIEPRRRNSTDSQDSTPHSSRRVPLELPDSETRAIANPRGDRIAQKVIGQTEIQAVLEKLLPTQGFTEYKPTDSSSDIDSEADAAARGAQPQTVACYKYNPSTKKITIVHLGDTSGAVEDMRFPEFENRIVKVNALHPDAKAIEHIIPEIGYGRFHMRVVNQLVSENFEKRYHKGAVYDPRDFGLGAQSSLDDINSGRYVLAMTLQAAGLSTNNHPIDTDTLTATPAVQGALHLNTQRDLEIGLKNAYVPPKTNTLNGDIAHYRAVIKSLMAEYEARKGFREYHGIGAMFGYRGASFFTRQFGFNAAAKLNAIDKIQFLLDAGFNHKDKIELSNLPPAARQGRLGDAVKGLVNALNELSAEQRRTYKP